MENYITFLKDTEITLTKITRVSCTDMTKYLSTITATEKVEWTDECKTYNENSRRTRGKS